jgi:hypothetical protein
MAGIAIPALPEVKGSKKRRSGRRKPTTTKALRFLSLIFSGLKTCPEKFGRSLEVPSLKRQRHQRSSCI